MENKDENIRTAVAFFPILILPKVIRWWCNQKWSR